MLPRACLSIVVAALACLSAGAAVEESDKVKKAFSEHASVAKLLEMAGEAHGKKDGDWEQSAFNAACRKASAGDLQHLAEYLWSYHREWVLPEEMYLRFADACTRNSLSKVLSHAPEFSAVALPDSLAKYPESLREVASYSRRINVSYETLKKNVLPRRHFRRHISRFNSTALGIAAEPPEASVERVLAYYEILCGCGRDRPKLEKSQAAAVLYLLVREKRWAEAVGAALFLRESSESARAVLSLAGIDLEKAMVGSLAIEAASSPSSRRRLTELLNEFLKFPGDGRVDTIIALAQAAPPEHLPLYILGLEKFLTKNPEPERKSGLRAFRGGWGFSGDDYLSSDVIPAVSADASRRALKFLCGLASPSLSNKTAMALVKAFDRRYLEESYPALRILLSHPARRVAIGADWALSDAEQDVDGTNIPPDARYRLLVNGQPLKNAKLDVVVPEKEGWSSSNDTTDGDGILSVDRDPFVDPQSPAREYLIKNISDPNRDAFIFASRLTLPKDENVVEVELSLHRIKLALVIPRFDTELAGKNMRVMISGPRLKTSFPSWLTSYRFDFPAARGIPLPRLASGTYELELAVPGCARWTGSLLVDADRDIRIALQKGSDIEYHLISSDGNAKHVIPRVLQKGKEIELEAPRHDSILRGIRPGQYVLRIPSSVEVRKRQGHILEDETRFGSFDIPFAVRPDSPAVLDLGAIALPPLPADEE